MTASRKLKDLKRGGVPFIMLGIVMPILFATMGIAIAHVFSVVVKQELTLGTYILSSVPQPRTSQCQPSSGWQSPRRARHYLSQPLSA